MTDSELLNGLQQLFNRNVAVLRTCRSGVKIELAHGDFRFADEPVEGRLDIREFFGSDDTGSEYGSDIRIAIQRAMKSELAEGEC